MNHTTTLPFSGSLTIDTIAKQATALRSKGVQADRSLSAQLSQALRRFPQHDTTLRQLGLRDQYIFVRAGEATKVMQQLITAGMPADAATESARDVLVADLASWEDAGA